MIRLKRFLIVVAMISPGGISLFHISYYIFSFARIQSECLDENFTLHVIKQDNLSNLDAKLQSIYLLIRSYLVETFQGNSKQIVQIYFPNFHSVIQNIWKGEKLDASSYGIVYNFVLKLKRLIRSSRAILVFGIYPQLFPSYQSFGLESLMDTIFTVESFTARMHAIPYEFKEFLGFFMVRKLQQLGMMASPPLKGTKFGIKRDRRKLHIEPLHLPPEESRATNSSLERANAAELKAPLKFDEKVIAKKEVLPPPAPPVVTEVKEQEKSTNSLAASLAAARAARAASKIQDSSLPKPISISKDSTTVTKGVIDF